jgi:putative endonuclease
MTTSEVSARINKHNNHSYGNHRFTAKSDDWEEFLVINCANNSQAIMVERHIKKMKSKVYIENLKKFPEMVEKLLEKMQSNRLSR